MRATTAGALTRILATILVVIGAVSSLAGLAAARDANGHWRLLDVGATRPPARRHAVMVYDAAYKRMVMFGGDVTLPGSVTAYNDLWALELGCGTSRPRWVQLQANDPTVPRTSSVRPSVRHDHAAALVPGTPNRMFLHGGQDVAGYLDDTWQLSLTATPTWTRKSTQISAAVDRVHHTGAYIGGSFRIFGGQPLLGGFPGSGMADTWTFNVGGTTWSYVSGNTTPSGPPCAPCPPGGYNIPDRRYWHSQIVDNGFTERTLVFGGAYDGEVNRWSNVWQSTNSGLTWSQLPTVPYEYSRELHTATYDPAGQRMVVIGGYDCRPDLTEFTLGGDATVGVVTALSLPLNLATSTWSTLSTTGSGPGQIASHVAAYDPGGDRIVVFGGVEENNAYLNDVWVLEFDGSAPAAIANLAAQSYGSNWIQFGWTAPGRNGVTGTACSYEIRYSANPITDDASFAAATLFASPPAPTAAGTAQTVKITGLNPSTVYYLAIKTQGESPNVSALSNVACGRIALPHVFCDEGGGGTLAGMEGLVEFALHTPRPNPSTGPLNVAFTLPRSGDASLELIDITGRRVAERLLGELRPGEHTVRLAEGVRLAPGYYTIRLRQGTAVLSRPVMIVR